jgi:uncharacterized protein (DUF697 family)
MSAPNTDGYEPENQEGLKKRLEEARKEVEEIGGLRAFKSGEWLLRLIQKSFRNYWEHANAEYFQTKYSSHDEEFIAKKLISVAARNTALLGGLTGAAVSADEIVAFFTVGEGGVGLPANIAIAATAMAGEAVLLMRFQLRLVANLGKVFSIPLDPDDPEDILTILAFAVGGSVAEAAGKLGMKIGGRIAKDATRKYISKELLQTLKRVGAKLGVKILQRTIIKYVVPIASIGIGLGWNYLSTIAVGKIAKKHFIARRSEKN